MSGNFMHNSPTVGAATEGADNEGPIAEQIVLQCMSNWHEVMMCYSIQPEKLKSQHQLHWNINAFFVELSYRCAKSDCIGVVATTLFSWRYNVYSCRQRRSCDGIYSTYSLFDFI